MQNYLGLPAGFVKKQFEHGADIIVIISIIGTLGQIIAHLSV